MSKKIMLIAGLLIVLGGSAYLLFRKKGDDSNEASDTTNLDDVRANVGENAKTDKDGNVYFSFNKGDNYAYFYPNKRFAIFKKGVSGFLVKGSYSNAGKKLVTDSGKAVESNSVWSNVLSLIKK
jgi:hypothetical protein